MIFAYQKTVDVCTWHYDKKNAPHFSILKSFIFLLEEKIHLMLCKRQISCKFQFIQRSVKRLSVTEMKREK